MSVAAVRNPCFARRREWLGELCRIAARLLVDAYEEALPNVRPGLILFVQTFGDWVNFNLHLLAADGAFLPDERFVALPPVPGTLLAEGFRRAALKFLVKNGALSEALRSRMLAWRHCGFSAHNAVRVLAEDTEGRKQLAGTMLRAPMSLEKMTDDDATGTVIYRSKMHAGLKRNFQVMPGAEWLALLCNHLPDRYEHLVRYGGWYSNRSRGARTAKAPAPAGESATEPISEFVQRAKQAWARLIARSKKSTRSNVRYWPVCDDRLFVYSILIFASLINLPQLCRSARMRKV